MNSNKIFTAAAFAILICSVIGCHVPKITQKDTKAFKDSIPASFTDTTTIDSSSLAEVSWRDFFKDSNLIHLIDTALIYNYDIRSSFERIKIAGAYLMRSKAALLPTINLAASASGTKYGKYTPDGVGNDDTNLSENINEDQRIPTSPTPDYWLGANVSWEADLWGKLQNMRDADKYSLLATKAGQQLLFSTLISQVAGLYFTLQGLDKEKKILKENIVLQRDGVERVKHLKAGGRSNELAVRQFVAQLYNTEAAEFEIDQKIISAESQLNALLGRFSHNVTRSDSSSLLTYEMHEGIPAAVISNRPDIVQAEMMLKAANVNTKAARAAFFPSFTVTGYSAFNAFKTRLIFSGGSLIYSIVGGLSAPIFQKKEIRAKFNIASAEQEIAFLQYQQSVVNAYQEVATRFSNKEKQLSIIEKKKQEVAELEKGVVSANELFYGGSATYLDIITSRQRLLQVQMELVNTEKDLMLVTIGIYKSVGGGVK